VFIEPLSPVEASLGVTDVDGPEVVNDLAASDSQDAFVAWRCQLAPYQPDLAH